MLVLKRFIGEKIYISEHICVTVVDIDRGAVRLGIEAPRNVPIHRGELLAQGPRETQPAPVREAVPVDGKEAPVVVTLADQDRQAAVLRAQAQAQPKESPS